MTWLYVPPEYSQSVPEAEGLTWDLESLARLLALSVTSNEKHSPPQLWLRRWKKDGWIRRLSGAISEPLTASRGVARWIGSLAVSPASPTASPVSSAELPTGEISGPLPQGSYETSDPASSSWRMFQESVGITSTPSDLSFKQWDTELRKDYSLRRKSVRPTSASGFSSWHTPASDMSTSHGGRWNGRYYIKKNGRKESSTLTHQTARWDPPPAEIGTITVLMDAITRMWPTQTARDAYAPSDADAERHQIPLRMEAAEWPNPQNDSDKWRSPQATDAKLELRDQAGNWPTILAEEGKERKSHGKGGQVSLARAARNFPTQVYRDYKDWDVRNKKSPSKNYEAYSHLELTTSMPGHKCSHRCRRLNPLFAEWLMGWPTTWTLLPLGVVDSGSLEMAWSHWWRRMRLAFLSIGREQRIDRC